MTWLGGAFVALLLLAIAGALSTSSANAAELDTDTASLMQSMDALVSGSESNAIQTTALAIASDDGPVGTNVLDSAVADERAIETERVFSAWAGQRIVLLNTVVDSATTNNNSPQNVLPSSVAGSPVGGTAMYDVLEEGNSPTDVSGDATVFPLNFSEGIFAGGLNTLAAFALVGMILGLVVLHVWRSPTSVNNGSGGKASPAFGKPSSNSDVVVPTDSTQIST